MEAHELHTRTTPSLLDKITADPGIINRGLAEAREPVEVAPVAPVMGDFAQALAETGPIAMQRDNVHRLASINLLTSRSEPAAGAAEQVVAKPKSARHKLALMAALVVVVLAAGTGGYFWLSKGSNKQSTQVTVIPAPTATVVPSPTPVPATPTPLPTPTPVPESVTAPAAVPTASHPQAVTVKSPTGLWLRSAPDSSKRTNIIGWIPNGGVVSVDNVGNFWWHGSYAGKAGYFAVNYTK